MPPASYHQVPFSHYTIDGQVITAVVIRRELPERPEGVPDWLWELLRACWDFEPAARIKIEEVVGKLGNLVV